MEEQAQPVDPPASTHSGVARRSFLVKAAVAGGVAWAAPAILSVDPAGAASLHSPPPVKPPVKPPTEVEGETVIDPGVVPQAAPATTVAATPASDTEVRGALAYTGANLDKLAAAGFAALVGGAALHQWSATRPPAPAPAEVAPPTEPPDPLTGS